MHESKLELKHCSNSRKSKHQSTQKIAFTIQQASAIKDTNIISNYYTTAAESLLVTPTNRA